MYIWNRLKTVATNVTLSEIVGVLFEFQIVRQISFLVTIMFEAGYNIRGQGDCGL